MKTWPHALGLALAALAQLSCATTPDPAVPPPAAPAAPPAAAAAPQDPKPATEPVVFDDDTTQVIGHPAPGWQIEHWFNSPPITLESLRGSVVLVRWFMSPECPYCSGTAPSLNKLYGDYKDRGLVVVGMYHHKRPEPLQPEDVKGYAAHFGFEFPVAVDTDWKTLKRWWLDGHEKRRWTSVSFLLDRKGIVRHVHLGGKYAPGDPDYDTMRGWIEKLVSEPAH